MREDQVYRKGLFVDVGSLRESPYEMLANFSDKRRLFMKVCALLRCGMVSTAIEFLWYGYLFKKPWQDGHACTLAEAHALQKIDA